MSDVRTINFLYLESYNGKDIWEHVTSFYVSDHLRFKTTGGEWKSTKISEVYYYAWEYRLEIVTRTGSCYRFKLCAPYGQADYEVCDSIMVSICEKLENQLS